MIERLSYDGEAENDELNKPQTTMSFDIDHTVWNASLRQHNESDEEEALVLQTQTNG